MDFVDFQNIIWVILPLLVIQLALLIIALWDWYNKREILGQYRIIWLVVILFFSIIGPIIYLLFGQGSITQRAHLNEGMDDWSV
ncbi:MAG: PLD nuclease N-terminal domain-containing protein [Candidatus Hodarchaeota archaeon]